MSRQIGEVPTRTFEPGAVIFREGDDAKGEAFMVLQGRVEIRKQIGGEERLLRALTKGELLGHIALFRNAPRSASAIAADAVTLMVISANRLDHLVRANPALALALIRVMSTLMLAAEDLLLEVEDRLGKK
jgi:CRP/FNR family cyclic AMP-dependent transcriptional regulator